MSERRFPILGSEKIPMLGRSRIMERIWNDLTKPTPSNLSLVGPRYIGKSVIMGALAQKASGPNSPYRSVLSWHLGHVPPLSDEDFIAQLCNLLRDALAAAGGDYAEHLELLGDRSFTCLQEITDSLDDDNHAILMLWDGFDKPLGQGNLSVRLWDQMRSLFYGKRHKIVTATRDLLSKLIRSQDAISSPFWNIFDMNPVRVGLFDDPDREKILHELPDYDFLPGAKTELLNWSAGFPPLYLDVLNQITNECSPGMVNNEAVNQAGRKTTERLAGLLSDLWQDCPAAAQDRYLHLWENGEIPLVNTGREERDVLIEKGLARMSGNKLTPGCRMLEQYLKGTNPDTGGIVRLFGTWNSYQANIRNLLERRLDQITKFDDLLHRLVARSIEDIPEYPDHCLNNLTGIEERALDLVWQREFGAEKVVPLEILDYWNRVNPTGRAVDSLHNQPQAKIPQDRTNQCGILQLLTGSKYNVDSKAKYVSKDTYVLINALHSFRNRNQHAGGEPIRLGVAIAAINLCLELLACLEQELSS